MGLSASQSRLLSLTARLSDLELQAQTISNAKIRLSQESAQASEAYSEALDQETLTVYNSANSAYANATVNNLTSYTNSLDVDSTNSKYRYLETASGSLIVTASLLEKAGLEVSDSTVSGTISSEDDFLSNCGLTKSSDGSWDTSSQSYKYYDNIYTKIANNQYTMISNSDASDSDWLTNQVAAGNVYLYEYDSDGGDDGTGAFENVSWSSGDSSLEYESDDTTTAKAEAEYEATTAEIETKDKKLDLELKNIDTEHTSIQTEIDSVKKVIDKNIERSFKIFNA